MRNPVKISLFYILLLALLFSAQLQGQRGPRYFLRAPDVLPGTLPEMRTPDFWADRGENPDKVIIPLNRIREMNEAYRERLKDLDALKHGLGEEIERQLKSWTGLVTLPPDLENLSGEEQVAAIREMVHSQIEFLKKREHGNLLAISYSEAEIGQMEAEMAFDRIGINEGIRHGLTVKDCRIRIIPTLRPEYVSVGDNSRSRWDMFNLDILPISTPVKILHASASGGYLLVISDRGYGWIRSEELALAEKKHVEGCIPAEAFIVCTGEKVPFYADRDCRYVSGWMRMGDRLAFTQEGDRMQVVVPSRQMDGTLSMEKAWLRKDADVSKGFLPYTPRNVMNQACKLLDLVYDYSGAWYGRNHITILRDLFSCFGFELPGNGVLLQAYHYSGSISPEAGKEAQYQAMLSYPPFITIQVTRGHSQLLIGEYEGTPYVFDTHGYSYPGEDENEYFIRRSCIYTPEIPGYMLKGEMVFVELK